MQKKLFRSAMSLETINKRHEIEGFFNTHLKVFYLVIIQFLFRVPPQNDFVELTVKRFLYLIIIVFSKRL